MDDNAKRLDYLSKLKSTENIKFGILAKDDFVLEMLPLQACYGFVENYNIV